MPALSTQCSENATAPSDVGEYLWRHPPHSTLRRLGAAGHRPHMGRPEEAVRVIRECRGGAGDE